MTMEVSKLTILTSCGDYLTSHNCVEQVFRTHCIHVSRVAAMIVAVLAVEMNARQVSTAVCKYLDQEFGAIPTANDVCYWDPQHKSIHFQLLPKCLNLFVGADITFDNADADAILHYIQPKTR